MRPVSSVNFTISLIRPPGWTMFRQGRSRWCQFRDVVVGLAVVERFGLVVWLGLAVWVVFLDLRIEQAVDERVDVGVVRPWRSIVEEVAAIARLLVRSVEFVAELLFGPGRGAGLAPLGQERVGLVGRHVEAEDQFASGAERGDASLVAANGRFDRL